MNNFFFLPSFLAVVFCLPSSSLSCFHTSKHFPCPPRCHPFPSCLRWWVSSVPSTRAWPLLSPPTRTTTPLVSSPSLSPCWTRIARMSRGEHFWISYMFQIYTSFLGRLWLAADASSAGQTLRTWCRSSEESSIVSLDSSYLLPISVGQPGSKRGQTPLSLSREY